MDASNAGRVVSLTNQIQLIKRALEIIDAGGTITAMTLQAPAVEPPEPPPTEPEPTEETGSDEPSTPVTPDLEPEEPRLVDPPVITIPTEDLIYPPQMMQSIRAQELQLWQSAADELGRLGVTNYPRPPAGQQAQQMSAQSTTPRSGPPSARPPSPPVTSPSTSPRQTPTASPTTPPKPATTTPPSTPPLSRGRR